MGLFDKSDHIKNSKDLERELKKKSSELHLTEKQRQEVAQKAKHLIDTPSGMSKEEWRKKVAGAIEKNERDDIDRAKAERLKKLGK